MTSAQTPARRRGRPPSTRTQDAIRAAATSLFADRGYGRTSIRDIAAEAGVDAGLVTRHFGSKDALFVETMAVEARGEEIVSGPLDTLGRAMLSRIFESEPQQGDVYAALYRAVDRPEVRDYLTTTTQHHIIAPLIKRLSGERRELRARLVAAQIAGLTFAVWVMKQPEPSSTSLAEMLDVYAAGLQAIINSDQTGTIGEPASLDAESGTRSGVGG